jgi:hypothetical protein
MTFEFRVIWTEFRRATALMTNDFTNHISCTWSNLSAGQIVTNPAKLLVLTLRAG